MSRRLRTLLLLAPALLAIPAVVARPAAPSPAHERLLTLDTHLDTPASLAFPGWSIADPHAGDYTQVDLPRMKKGGLDGGFWAIYTPQGPLDAASTRKARDFALKRAVAIHAMVAANPRDFALADKAEDAARIAAQGKRVVYLSIENAWPLGDDPTLLQSFHALGVRIAGFAHFRTNQFADSSTDKAKWDGLSPLGVQLLAEMNRLGVVPDLSHSSDAALADALRLSKAPVILSHSGCKAVYDHPRNVSDDQLRALAAQGGVIQINSVYLKKGAPNPQREAAMKALEEHFPEDAALTPDAYARMLAERHEIDRRFPQTDRATFDDFMANLLHALKVAGTDHVGIGADWDGGGGVVGMEDVTALPRITAALLAAGYSEADVAKVWSGNVLRVLAAAEAEAAREAAGS
ncbi:dipeptidase [Novosphingobium sp. KCTC 2891]|uniref:dipeptidase n=1 Tax=Novosphingobium sp. KCTC 2891 TaxID=2989730 RepID=UPI002223B5FA|nr:dipeptidase [Novosphingobium sp. KCTC 2891]MCW1383401.1 dipeptidase [Novosphingobium sp. KCTC 2891]